MLLFNGHRIPTIYIVLALLFIVLAFPKTVFTLMLLLFLGGMIGVGLIVYRIRKWLHYLRTTGSQAQDHRQARSQRTESTARIYECEEYEVIKEDKKQDDK